MIKKIIGSSLITIFSVGIVYADGLPQIGTDCGEFKTSQYKVIVDTNGNVVKEGEMPVYNSSGVRYDRDCTTMFVMPPKVGVFTITGLARVDAMEHCESRNVQHESMIDTQKEISSILKQIAAIDPSDPDAKEKKEFLMGTILFLRGELELTKESLSESSKYPGYAASILLELEWDEIVQEYKKLNPGKNVARIPIRGSYITATVSNRDEVGDLIQNDGEYQALRSAVIPGIVSRPKPFDWLEGNGLSEPVVMNGTTGAQVVLNLPGACPFENSLEKARKNGKQITLADLNKEGVKLALKPYMVANLTYYYPMHTDTKFRVEINIDTVAEIFKSIINTKSTVSVSKVVKDFQTIDHQGAIKVTFEAGAGNETNESVLSIAELNEKVTTSVVRDLLNKFGEPTQTLDPIEDLPPPSDPHYVELRSKYVCDTKSYLFGIVKKNNCHSETYTVNVPAEGWGKSITEFFKDVHITHTENWKITNTIFQAGTLTFSK